MHSHYSSVSLGLMKDVKCTFYVIAYVLSCPCRRCEHNCRQDGGAENAGVENAGVENAGGITYGKPPEQKTLKIPGV